jgi:polysaccharide biosynthesis protein PslH
MKLVESPNKVERPTRSFAMEQIDRAASQGTGRPRLRVAVIDEELPYPLLSGKRIRTFNLLTRLAGRHDITFICHRNTDPAEAEEAQAVFHEHGIRTVIADQATPGKSALARGPLFYGRLLRNLLSPLPYIVAINTSVALRRAIEAHAARQDVDVWHCEWTPCAQVLQGLTRKPVLVMAHNIESQIWQRYHETENNWLKRWYIKHQQEKLEYFERKTFSLAARSVFVSAQDAALAQTRFDADRVAVVENGVDVNYFPFKEGTRDARRILFLGSLDWRPNLDAAQILLDQIFPRVQAAEPGAKLCIVGRNPPEWLVRRAAQSTGVELAASVPDVRPYLHACGVMAVPLRIGGGSRLKILEALAAGLPVVSSTIGAEGLCLEDGSHFIIADDVDEAARALLQCMRKPEQALALARRGRERVVQTYDWQPLADKLATIWADCAGKENA